MQKKVKKNVSCATQSWYAHVTLNKRSICLALTKNMSENF